jgi:chemotaxis protein methyltransferase CheR
MTPPLLTSRATSTLLRRCVGRPYFLANRWIWGRLPGSWRRLAAVRAYGMHVHDLVLRRATRHQSFGTFFLRNRPELELMCRLAKAKRSGETFNIAVLACSKGAEAYSIAWALRTACPELTLVMQAVDISPEVLAFAERGVYSLKDIQRLAGSPLTQTAPSDDAAWNTCRDQIAPIFERMSAAELEAMCDRIGDEVRVKPWVREGIAWRVADAIDVRLPDALGPQDMVVANRFLCHMDPAAADTCLRNLARLVRAGGYLFVSGVDLDVRTKVARELAWEPMTELFREIHEGDASLRRGWPLEYWGLEPLHDGRSDWRLRYAAAFRIGKAA